jgi:hypothetical protein
MERLKQVSWGTGRIALTVIMHEHDDFIVRFNKLGSLQGRDCMLTTVGPRKSGGVHRTGHCFHGRCDFVTHQAALSIVESCPVVAFAVQQIADETCVVNVRWGSLSAVSGFDLGQRRHVYSQD